MNRLAFVLLLLWAAPCARAAGAATDAAERERIAAERAVAETRFAEERLACERNFVVTSCVDAARKRERDTLADLRRQEALLDEAQRRQRAAERMAAIRAKVSAEDERRRQQALQPPRARPLQLPRSPAAGPAGAASMPSERAASAPPARVKGADAEHEARSRARFDARQRDAREHRAAAQRRAAQRASQGHVAAAPLPVPAAASAP